MTSSAKTIAAFLAKIATDGRAAEAYESVPIAAMDAAGLSRAEQIVIRSKNQAMIEALISDEDLDLEALAAS